MREEKTDDPEVVSSNKNDLVSVLLSLSKLREFARSIGAKHGGQHPFAGLNVAGEYSKRYVKSRDIKTHRKRRPKALSEEELQEATLDYLSGMRLIDIAKRHGFSRWFLTKQFREAKVPIRRQSMTIEQVRVAESLYASGLSLERVGEITGLPKSTIRRAFVRNGIGMRGV